MLHTWRFHWKFQWRFYWSSLKWSEREKCIECVCSSLFGRANRSFGLFLANCEEPQKELIPGISTDIYFNWFFSRIWASVTFYTDRRPTKTIIKCGVAFPLRCKRFWADIHTYWTHSELQYGRRIISALCESNFFWLISVAISNVYKKEQNWRRWWTLNMHSSLE